MKVNLPTKPMKKGDYIKTPLGNLQVVSVDKINNTVEVKIFICPIMFLTLNNNFTYKRDENVWVVE